MRLPTPRPRPAPRRAPTQARRTTHLRHRPDHPGAGRTPAATGCRTGRKRTWTAAAPTAGCARRDRAVGRTWTAPPCFATGDDARPRPATTGYAMAGKVDATVGVRTAPRAKTAWAAFWRRTAAVGSVAKGSAPPRTAPRMPSARTSLEPAGSASATGVVVRAAPNPMAPPATTTAPWGCARSARAWSTTDSNARTWRGCAKWPAAIPNGSGATSIPCRTGNPAEPRVSLAVSAWRASAKDSRARTVRPWTGRARPGPATTRPRRPAATVLRFPPTKGESATMGIHPPPMTGVWRARVWGPHPHPDPAT